MTEAYDYLLDSNGDLMFQNGDLVVGPSDDQHIQDTINAFPGWWKQYPADGVGIAMHLKSRGPFDTLRANIRKQLQSDGYTVGNVTITVANGKTIINPSAIRQ